MQYIIFFDKIVVTYVNERSILMKKEKVLKKYFGHKKFRDGQSEIIDNILEGNDILGIMPTGAGKINVLPSTGTDDGRYNDCNFAAYITYD